MVATATRTILENLDRIPDEDGRTKVAIICYDVSLYFFSLTVCFLSISVVPVLIVSSLAQANLRCSLSPILTMSSCPSPMICWSTLWSAVQALSHYSGELGTCSKRTASLEALWGLHFKQVSNSWSVCRCDVITGSHSS